MTNTTERPPAADTTAIRTREHHIARRTRFSGWAEPVALVGAMVVLVIVFSLLNPRFASVGNLQNILDQATVPLIVGVGATLVILLGSIDLSVEGVMGAAGMAWILLSANTRGGPDLGPLAWIIALAVGAALGWLSGVIFTRLKVPSFIVTLGIWYVGLGVATILFGTESIPTLTDDALSTWSSQTTAGIPNGFWLAVGVVVLGVLLLRYTRFGRLTLAIGDNEGIARSAGMPVARIKTAVFLVAGLLSGLAGIIATMKLGAGSATVGAGTLFLVIPAVVIGGTSLGGGRGGILRTVLGVFLLTLLSNGLILSGVSPSFQSAVSGAILVVAIVAAAWSQRNRLRIAK
ncbi:ABC transporter permease [Microbacterium sp. Bi128]|uniref:ABC transporter permease n=1 Tax=Microbacterium sp. Bi128 TaxID=2821115 RepID=UPI001D384391|nr:ABC transporter permease [Microbacterium sp. Bi128]CAH0158587.1 Ribose import permease protein RbsC [Microbacterium sp. Bi128]